MLSLYELRNNDFIRQCRKMTLDAPSGKHLTMRQIAEKAICGGAPRYYVTFDYAYRMLRKWRNGDFSDKCDDIRVRQWRELAAKTDELKSKNPGLTDYTALGRVLAFDTASRFFISPGYALRLIHRISRENDRCRHKRCRHYSH